MDVSKPIIEFLIPLDAQRVVSFRYEPRAFYLSSSECNLIKGRQLWITE